MKEKFLKYHGAVKSLKTSGSKILFVTQHTEQHPTALYCLDAEKMELESSTSLPCGAVDLTLIDDAIWVAGTDNQLHHFTDASKAPKLVKTGFEEAISAMSLAAKDILLASKNEIKVISSKGKVIETIKIAETEVSALSASKCGEWIAIGCKNGEVHVYQREESKTFAFSAKAKLHDGIVYKLFFDDESLRFLSAGLDGKLLYTHARGELEPEDRGRGSSHTDRVTSIISVTDERFLTAGKDAVIKSWVKGSGTRPSSFDKIGKVVSMSVVDIYERPHLAVACANNTIQFLLLKDGKIDKKFATCSDIYHALEKEISAVDIKRKEAAFSELAVLNDRKAIEIIGDQIGSNRDVKLRVMAAELIADSGHEAALTVLLRNLESPDAEVRSICFNGALKHAKGKRLETLKITLNAGQNDISVAALEELKKDAAKSEEALALLISGLNVREYEIRLASLLLLEEFYGASQPDGALLALQSKAADTRRDAIYRLYKNDQTNHPKVSAALRANIDHDNAEVRDAVWYASLYSRPELVKALRCRDGDIHRQLWEWETARPLVIVDKEKKANKEEAKKAPAKPKKTKVSLEPADYDPLYQAMASHSPEVSLNGAVCLAILGERRALGLLLQLSNTEDPIARQSVCKALAFLSDSRAEERLYSLLYDTAAEVRGAAFSGLLKLSKDPLDVAEAALLAKGDDVRMLGFKLLLKEAKKKLPKSAKDRTWQLLEFSLHNGSGAVRLETYKAALNLELGGSTASSLEFALLSRFKEIRKEVLTEVMAQSNESWAWDILLGLFNDPESEIRIDAYRYAIKSTKSKDEAPMVSALKSEFRDIRQAAVHSLTERKTESSQAALSEAIEDPEVAIRSSALLALIGQSVESALLDALSSSFFDVQINAAKALAKSSSPKAKEALLVLLQLEKPAEEKKEALKNWNQAVLGALAGLELLADSSLVETLLPFVEFPEAEIAQAAMKAVGASIEADQLELIDKYVKHSDQAIKTYATYAFALTGDRRGLASLGKNALNYISVSQQITAALMIGKSEDGYQKMLQLASQYQGENFIMLANVMDLLDWISESPQFALASISAEDPHSRFDASHFIEVFHQTGKLESLVTEEFNTRPSGTAWTVAGKELQLLAKVIQYGAPHTVSRAIELLSHFEASIKKQDAWNLGWQSFQERHAKEVTACGKKKLPKKSADEVELQELVFGCYIGLARDQRNTNVATSALRRLIGLGGLDAFWCAQVKPVCLQSLFANNADIRNLAFEGLVALDEDPNYLAGQSLEAGYLDLGTKGLKLLAKEAGKDGAKVLENAMLERRDDLSIEAAKLLCQSKKVTPVATLALDARYPNMRSVAIQWLAQELKDGDKKAQKSLVKATGSDQYELRLKAVQALAKQKDSAAFDILTTMLDEVNNENDCRPLIRAYNDLGDANAAKVLIDRAARDVSDKSNYKSLITAAASYRRVEDVDALFKLAQRDAWRLTCFETILTISGHDQYIFDHEDEKKEGLEFERAWMKDQHPRHDEILATLLTKVIEAGDLKFAVTLIESARWSQTQAVGDVMDPLVTSDDEGLRHSVVEAIAFRFCHREGSADVLSQLLKHKEPITQFIAAEGLALGGNAAGLNILLSAVELMEDLDYRVRAVTALGKLADQKSFDLLFRLANEPDHALQSTAATALGHLRKGDDKGKVFNILKEMTQSDSREKVEAAIRGLRYYDSAEGWELIRGLVDHHDWWVQNAVYEELQHNDDPATLALILKRLEDNPSEEMLLAARKLSADDSLEPDYAVIRGNAYYGDYRDNCIQRICDSGETSVMLELLPKCIENQKLTFMTALATRSIPVKELDTALLSKQVETVKGAAQLIAKGSLKSKNLDTSYQYWLDRLEKDIEVEESILVLPEIFEALAKLDQPENVMAFIDQYEGRFEEVRTSAMTSICANKQTAKVVDWIITKVEDSNLQIRDLAVQVLALSAEKKLTKVEDNLVYDARYYKQLAIAGLAKKSASYVDHAHYGGVVLDQMVSSGDIGALVKSINNKDLTEPVKIALIQGLSSYTTTEAEDALAKIGKDKKLDEELRQVAWRARRKSVRLRLKKEAK